MFRRRWVLLRGAGLTRVPFQTFVKKSLALANPQFLLFPLWEILTFQEILQRLLSRGYVRGPGEKQL